MVHVGHGFRFNRCFWVLKIGLVSWFDWWWWLVIWWWVWQWQWVWISMVVCGSVGMEILVKILGL